MPRVPHFGLRELLSSNASDLTDRLVLRDADRTTLRSEFSVLLQKSLYCCRMGFIGSLCVFLDILRQGFLLDQGLAPMLIIDHELLDQLIDLVTQSLQLPTASAANNEEPSLCLLEAVEMCAVMAATTIKEKLAPKCLPLILRLMSCPFYRISRSAATTLINFLRGSKLNRDRASTHLSSIGDILVHSTDMYFQIACCEILFRLHTHNPSLLKQGGVAEHVQQAISGLPNDATLLVAIETALVDVINTRRSDSHNIETVDVTGLDISYEKQNKHRAAEQEQMPLCGATRIHFNRNFLVFLAAPEGHAQATVTIPYADVRSLRVSKDQTLRVSLNHVSDQLLAVAPSLHDYINDNNEEDPAVTLHIFVTTAALGQLKQSSVYSWITAARAKRSASTTTAPTAKRASSKTTGGSPSKRSRSATHRGGAEQHDTEDEGLLIRPRSASRAAAAAPANLSSLVAEQLASKRAQLDELRADTMAHIQALVEQYRVESAADRDAFQQLAKQSKSAVAEAESSLKEYATSSVAQLNQELIVAQDIGEALQKELRQIETEVAQCVSRVSEVESEKLKKIKGMVDGDLATLETMVVSVLAASNPLNFFAR